MIAERESSGTHQIMEQKDGTGGERTQGAGEAWSVNDTCNCMSSDITVYTAPTHTASGDSVGRGNIEGYMQTVMCGHPGRIPCANQDGQIRGCVPQLVRRYGTAPPARRRGRRPARHACALLLAGSEEPPLGAPALIYAPPPACKPNHGHTSGHARGAGRSQTGPPPPFLDFPTIFWVRALSSFHFFFRWGGGVLDPKGEGNLGMGLAGGTLLLRGKIIKRKLFKNGPSVERLGTKDLPGG
jgi:hypothetical protein